MLFRSIYCGNSNVHHERNDDSSLSSNDGATATTVNDMCSEETVQVINSAKTYVYADDIVENGVIKVAQLDGGAKASVTNDINVLHNVKWYGPKYKPYVYMKGATSKAIIVPKAQGYMRVKANGLRDGYLDALTYFCQISLQFY